MSALPQLRRSTDAVLPVRVGHALAVHEASVGHRLTETLGIEPEKQTESDGSCDSVDLRAAIEQSLRCAGLSHKEAAITMGVSPATWSKQLNGLEGHHVALDRLVLLGPVFLRYFVPYLAAPAQLVVSHADLAELTVVRVIGLASTVLTEATTLLAHIRREKVA